MSDEPTSDHSADSMELGSEMRISATPPISDKNASDRATAYRLSPKVEEKRLAEIACDFLENPRKPIGVPQRLEVIAMSTGRGQTAESIARQHEHAHVILWYIDQYHSLRAIAHSQLQEAPAIDPEATDAGVVSVESPTNLEIRCIADLPEKEFDLALLPLQTSGEQELARDFLQQCYDRLRVGGTLIASVDNPKDRWLHDQLKGYEKSVKVRPFEDAMVYLVEKTKTLKKLKDFSCSLAYRDCDELIQLITRPGVFSHRQLDNGARQLLDAVDVYPQSRLIDIGCGSGSVALGLAMRDPSARVHAVDSNARAIWCVEQGKQLNKLSNITTELNATGMYDAPGTFDMALANPPYFGDFQIAEKFIEAAHRSLRPGGRLVLVTKQPAWYEENLVRWFHDTEVFPSRRYHIASGVK
jgi:16S rRNA (guanine1207-N2)-methyltransferase